MYIESKKTEFPIQGFVFGSACPGTLTGPRPTGGLNFYTYIGPTNSHFKRIGPIESFSNSLSKFISNSLPNSFSSDSLHKLVPNFLKKCTQFTKSLNWF